MSNRARDALEISVEVLEHGLGLPLPERATPGSSGVDLRAAVSGDLVVEPGARVAVPTGIRVGIPAGFEWQVRPRSGLALETGMTVLNSPGTIDSDYRGEVRVILINLGTAKVRISRGMRIAQAVLARVHDMEMAVTDTGLPETDRGDGGFGHTGS